jgi:hypothetical protein
MISLNSEKGMQMIVSDARCERQVGNRHGGGSNAVSYCPLESHGSWISSTSLSPTGRALDPELTNCLNLTQSV